MSKTLYIEYHRDRGFEVFIGTRCFGRYEDFASADSRAYNLAKHNGITEIITIGFER